MLTFAIPNPGAIALSTIEPKAISDLKRPYCPVLSKIESPGL